VALKCIKKLIKCICLCETHFFSVRPLLFRLWLWEFIRGGEKNREENSSEFSIKTDDNTFNRKIIIMAKGICVCVCVGVRLTGEGKSGQIAEAINLDIKCVFLLQSETRLCACLTSVSRSSSGDKCNGMWNLIRLFCRSHEIYPKTYNMCNSLSLEH